MKRLLDRHGLTLLLAVSLLARLPGLLLGVEHYGDAPVRIEVAERWIQAPHLWRGFTESYQYGPLHLSLLGGALALLPDRLLAPKLLSLACGLLSIWLLWRLTRRALGPAAALFAGLGLALDALHLQASTTGASEAVYLALALGAIERLQAARGAWDEAPLTPASRRLALLLSALLLGAAGLVRYDGWMLAPVLGLLLLADLRKSAQRGRDLAWSVLWGAIAAAPALGWMALNARWAGHPLAPLRFIEADHRALAEMGLRWFGQVTYRLYCLVYWPVNVLGLSTPLFGLLSLAGAWRALWRRARGWELALIAWLPALYFTFRGAVLGNFRPLSRFVLFAAALSLPFAWDALCDLARWLAARSRRPFEALRAGLAAASLALLVAVPAALFAVSYGKESNLAEWARPLSPVSTAPPGVTDAARWLRAHARPDDVVLLDGVWNYLEIPLAFESCIPERQLIRLAYDNFEEKLGQVEPTLAVLIYQGNLRWKQGAQDATEEHARFTFRGRAFCREAAFVFASVYRRCDR